MNLQTKIVINKFYKYSNTIVKVKKITKNLNKILVTDLTSKQEMAMPFEGAELIMHRIYTIGEVAKIVEKRSDTIRKYEKKGLIPSGKKFSESCESYKNWRYYDREDVYNMVSFFNNRTPGRPVSDKNINVQAKVIRISEKIKIGKR
jgi:hypothetical protein